MPIKSCISKLKSPELSKRFDDLVASGMNEYVAAREVISMKHKGLHDRFNALKGTLKLPTSNYIPLDSINDKVSSIEMKAMESLSKLREEAETGKKVVKEKAEAVKNKKEEKKKEPEKKKPEPKKQPQPAKKETDDKPIKVGGQFNYNGSNWTVVEVGENRVKVTNGSVQTSFDRKTLEGLVGEGKSKKADKKEDNPKSGIKEGSTSVVLTDEARIERRKRSEDILTDEGSTFYDDVNLQNAKIGDEIHYQEYKDDKFIKHKTKVKDIVDGEVIFENGQTSKDVSSYMNITAEDAWFAKNKEKLLPPKEESSKPKLNISTRFTDKQIIETVEHYGVKPDNAVRILDIISTETNKTVIQAKIDDILAQEEQRASINAPMKEGQAVGDEELSAAKPDADIIKATSDFENKERTALANTVAVSFEQAQKDLKNDKRVQFDSGTENLEGLGKQSLFDVMTGDNTGRQRGLAAAYIAAHRLISDKNSPLVALMGKVGKRIRIIDSSIFNVYDPKGKYVTKFDSRQEAEEYVAGNEGYRVEYPPIMSAQEDGTLVLNAHMLNERLEEFWGEKRFFNWMEMALYEEAIHLTQLEMATEAEMNRIFQEMTPDEKQLVADKYGVKPGELSKFQMASEYIRMLVQNNLFGTTTEMLKPKRMARNYLSRLLRRLVDYFGAKKDNTTTQVVRRIENMVRGGQETGLPKMVSVERAVSEKPRIGVLEDGPGGIIYKVQYKNYQFAVAQSQSRAGLVFYEVEKINGVWSPKELLGSNPSEAMAALKIRVDQRRSLGTSIGEKGAANLDRFPGEAGIRLQNLQVAKNMREAGIGDIAVKLATGWELGGDGKWRYEIADDQIKFEYGKILGSKPGQEFKLSELLQHPELYKSYPFLSDTIVFGIASGELDGIQGYVTTDNKIGLSVSALDVRSTLIHEIQHLIQREEGFAKGGNSSTYYKTMSDANIYGIAENNVSALIAESDRLVSRINEYNDFQNAINYMSSRDRQWAQDVIQSLDFIISLTKKRQDVYEAIHRDKLKFKNKPEGWSVQDHPDMVDINKKISDSSTDLVNLLNKSYDKYPIGSKFTDSTVNEMWVARLYEKASLKDIFNVTKNDALSELSANNERVFIYSVAMLNKDRSMLEQLIADDNADSYKMYKRLAGEVEARNTQKRESLSAEERRESLLADTEDVAEADKIYLMTEIGNTQVERNQEEQKILNTSRSDNFEDEFLNKKYNEFHGKPESQKGKTYDPVADYVLEKGKDIISEVGYTHLKRMAASAVKSESVDLSDYEVASHKLAQAEWDMGEIVSKVFSEYEFDSALDYFIDKLRDPNVAVEIRNILSRKLIEKFEGRPDIAKFLRIKIDLPLGNKAGSALVSRRDWGTRDTGRPDENKTSKPPSRGVSTRGMWGRGLSEEQENLIATTVEGGEDIVSGKAAVDQSQDLYVSEEIEETLGMMLDQSEERVKELEDEISELKKSVSSDIKKDATTAAKKADKLSKEFAAAKSDAAMARLNKRWKSKNAIKELKDLINKIAKSCSA